MKRQKIIEVLVNLAADADRQVQYLEGLGLPGYTKPVGQDLRNTDELALEFDDVLASREALRECGELTDTQIQCLQEMDSLLDTMSGSSKAHLWTVEALYGRPEWEEVRKRALMCLSLFRSGLQ